MLKNAKFFDKMLIFLKNVLSMFIKISQDLKHKNVLKSIQWLNNYYCTCVLNVSIFGFFGSIFQKS